MLLLQVECSAASAVIWTTQSTTPRELIVIAFCFRAFYGAYFILFSSSSSSYLFFYFFSFSFHREFYIRVYKIDGWFVSMHRETMHQGKKGSEDKRERWYTNVSEFLSFELLFLFACCNYIFSILTILWKCSEINSKFFYI